MLFIVKRTTNFTLPGVHSSVSNYMQKIKHTIDHIPKSIRIFIFLDFFFAGLFILNLLWGSPYPVGNRLLDLNSETSFSTWYSSVKLFCIAFVFAVFFLQVFNRGKITPWLLLPLPILFCLMSMDEIVMLHETIGDHGDAKITDGGTRSDTMFKKTGAWFVIIGIPFLIGFYLYLSVIKKYFSEAPRSFLTLAAGMAVFLLGAVGFELVSNFLPEGRPTYLVRLLEESFEMFGASIMLWAAIMVTNFKLAHN